MFVRLSVRSVQSSKCLQAVLKKTSGGYKEHSREHYKSHTKWEPKICQQNVDKSDPSLVSFVCKYTFLSIIPLNIY